jgi:two-component system OmpR family sensor kinase
MMHPIDPRSWPIRWRLTALNVGVLALTLALLGGVAMFQLDNALITITADHLRDQARLALAPPGRPGEGPGDSGRGGGGPGGPGGPGVAGSAPGSGFGPGQQPGPGQALPPEPRPSPEARPGGPGGEPLTSQNFLARVAMGLVRRLTGPDTGALVFDSSGALVAAPDATEGVETWPQADKQQLARSLAGAEVSTVVPQQTRRALVLTMPLRSPFTGEIDGVLELASSLELTESVETRLRAMLAIGTVLALLVATGLSLRATRSALRPLDQVIQAARRIGAGQLDVRLRSRRRDEIGDLAEAFDSMLDRLATALIAQRRFVADAAHELRTPLTALGGMIDMLEIGAHRGDPVKFSRITDTMSREVQRLGRLVADLLTLSRLDSDQPLRLAQVELGPLVSEVAQQTRLLANGQAIDLQLDAAPTIYGDADRLRQVLINLASNALAHTPTDGTITFRVGEDRGWARLVVADTGSGIAPDLLPRVMDRFARGDDSRARSTGGAGLGLAIVQGIVAAHHGTIALDSEAGHGTTATVDLPATSIAPPAPAAPPPALATPHV